MVDEVRPRFGELIRGDTGEVVPVVFHPTEEDPKLFVGPHAGSETPLRFRRDDRLTVDVLGPGQRVVVFVVEDQEG